MAVGPASILAFVGIVFGILGILLLNVVAIFLAVALFGIAIIAVDYELSDMRERLNAGGGGLPRGWAPTCPSCGLDVTGTESMCPHCGKPLALTPPTMA